MLLLETTHLKRNNQQSKGLGWKLHQTYLRKKRKGSEKMRIRSTVEIVWQAHTAVHSATKPSNLWCMWCITSFKAALTKQKTSFNCGKFLNTKLKQPTASDAKNVACLFMKSKNWLHTWKTLHTALVSNNNTQKDASSCAMKLTHNKYQCWERNVTRENWESNVRSARNSSTHPRNFNATWLPY